MGGAIEVRETGEPSARGIALMRLVRDVIAAWVDAVATELTQPTEQENAMPAIHVYEPALCCSTGVCGPDLDQALVVFTADLDHLKGLGADIARHSLASDPAAFAENGSVRSFLQVAGSEGLPLTMVDGVTVITGIYPTRVQLLRYAGLVSAAAAPMGVSELGLTETAGGRCGLAGCCQGPR
jgi:hypothetical protein